MLFYFYLNVYYFETSVIGLVIVISIIVNIAATEVLFDPSSLAPGEQPQNPNFASKYLDSWRFVLSVNL